MSLLEFSATAHVGVSVPNVDWFSLFHSFCKRTASLKSSNSDGGTTGRYGKLEVAVVLRLGKFIAYSSSKIRFFGLMPFSLACGTVLLISCSRTASSSKRVTVCLGGRFPLHFFCNKATCLFSSAQFFTPFEIYFEGLEAIISLSIFLANESSTDLYVWSLLL